MKRALDDEESAAAKQARQVEAARSAVRSLVSQWDVPGATATAGLGSLPGHSQDTTHYFAKDQVGRIIGPAGRTVQTIRERSGARIKIQNDVTPQGLQAVIFSGTDEQVRSAVALVNEAIVGAAGAGASGTAMTEVRQVHERDSIGKLIGAGGSMISSLRQRSGAMIKIANEKIPGTTSQEVTISGSSEQVQVAMGLIAETIATAAADNRAVDSGAKVETSEAPVAVRQVPTALIGRVIGPGGQVIKSMREKTGARINVANETLPGTTEQQIRLWGAPEQVAAALTMIDTVLATAPADGGSAAAASGSALVAAGDVTQTYSIEKDIAKRLIGPAGGTIQKVRELSGAKVKIGNDPIPGTSSQPLTITGTEHQVAVALAMVNEIAANPAAPGASGSSPSAAKTEEKHAVPASLVGKVIGHGGQTIRTIREQSGAKILLENEPTPGTDEHSLTLSGSAAEVQMALAMINAELSGGGVGAQAAPSTLGLGLGSVAQQPAMGMPGAPPGYPQQPAYFLQAPPGFMLVPIPQAPGDPYAQMYGGDPSLYGAYQQS